MKINEITEAAPAVEKPLTQCTDQDLQKLLGKGKLSAMVKHPWFQEYRNYSHAYKHGVSAAGFTKVAVYSYFPGVNVTADGKIRPLIMVEFTFSYSGTKVVQAYKYYRDKEPNDNEKRMGPQAGWKHFKTWKEEEDLVNKAWNRHNEKVSESDTYQPPQLNVGDKILKGKFKNSPAEIKGFKKDKHNQPVLKTNKGDVQLFKPRVTKLMAESNDTIKSILNKLSSLPFADKIIVFGSVARGDSTATSDLDVVVEAEIPYSPSELKKYRELINIGHSNYGSFDPFVMFTDLLAVRNDECTGWSKAKNANNILRNIKKDGRRLNDLPNGPITEGGWASTKTQNTVITPQFVADVRIVLQGFEKTLNAHLASKNLPPVGIGHPCGSGTYYERDLKVNPTKEYGDIDVHFYIPRMPELNNNQTTQLFADNVKEFCNENPNYETENGKNVIVKTGNDYVQVDLVTIYYDNEEWAAALAPEWNVKGVITASIYSSLALTLGVSISSHGVQVKIRDNAVVPFSTIKNIELKTISTDPKNWATDIAKFFGCHKLSTSIQQFPGLKGEVKITDIVGSINGIADSFELNNIFGNRLAINSKKEFMQQIASTYQNKIDAVITSSKFDKAMTPASQKKAEYTKTMLTAKSKEVISLLLQ